MSSEFANSLPASVGEAAGSVEPPKTPVEPPPPPEKSAEPAEWPVRTLYHLLRKRARTDHPISCDGGLQTTTQQSVQDNLPRVLLIF